MSTTIIPLSQLPLSDDFMFGEVMRQGHTHRKIANTPGHWPGVFVIISDNSAD